MNTRHRQLKQLNGLELGNLRFFNSWYSLVLGCSVCHSHDRFALFFQALKGGMWNPKLGEFQDLDFSPRCQLPTSCMTLGVVHPHLTPGPPSPASLSLPGCTRGVNITVFSQAAASMTIPDLCANLPPSHYPPNKCCLMHLLFLNEKMAGSTAATWGRKAA